MTALIIALIFIGISVSIFLAVAVREARLASVRRASAVAELADTGLQLSGDPTGPFVLRGRFGDMELELHANEARRLPGPSGQERTVSVVLVDVAMPDFVVCRALDRDAVMGALPSAPRILSQHSHFDREYAIFSHEHGQNESRGFRSLPAQLPVVDGRAGVIEQLMDLGLEWIRVQGGRCELACAPIDSANAQRLLVAGLNFARVGTIEPIALPPSRPSQRDPHRPSPWTPIIVGVAVAAFGLLFGGPLLGFLPVFRKAFEADVCGENDRLVIVDHGDSYNVACSSDWGRSLTGYFMTCGALFAGVVLLVSASVAANRALKA